MPAVNHNPKVDAYLGKVQPFALPILEHLRDLVHKGCPGVEETIKWGRPFFEYKGSILGNMAAFKQHCSFGFWGEEIGAVLQQAKAVRGGAMGSLGRITTRKDLPPDKQLLGWLRQAAGLIESGQYTSPIAARYRVVKTPKPESDALPELTAALAKDKKAAALFAAFTPGRRRGYIDWIQEAKRADTRTRRISQAVAQISQGKARA